MTDNIKPLPAPVIPRYLQELANHTKTWITQGEEDGEVHQWCEEPEFSLPDEDTYGYWCGADDAPNLLGAHLFGTGVDCSQCIIMPDTDMPEFPPKLKEVMDHMERSTVFTTGVHMFSGGFAAAELVGHDEEYYDIQLKWGVQDGDQDSVHTENYKLRRSAVDDRSVVIICDNLEDA